MPLQLNPNIATAPLYVGGAAIEDIRAQYGVEEIIKIGSNESPIGPSPLAIAAMQQAAVALNRYPPMGDDDLRAVLAETLGQGLTADHFFTGNGGCDILQLIAAGFLSSEAEIIISPPTFPIYEITARKVGAKVIYAPLDPVDFSYNVDSILAAVTDRTRLIYVCSPNNPTGSIITAAQMERLVHDAPEHVVIVSDEVYHHFATAPDRADSLAYVRQGKNIIVIHSFSKAFGLAGLRLGYGLAPVELARYLARARLPFHLSRLAIEGGIAGLQDEAHTRQVVDLVLSGRDWLYGQLLELGVEVWPGQANFLLFKPAFEATVVSEELLKRGVIVRPMGNFYLPDHLRVTIGLPEENQRFVTTLGEVLAALA